MTLECRLQLQIRVPPLEHRPELLIQDFDPHLQQEVRAALGLLHLLLLAEAFADHLIHGRLHKTGADPFPRTVALTVVGNEAFVVLNIHLLYL